MAILDDTRKALNGTPRPAEEYQGDKDWPPEKRPLIAPPRGDSYEGPDPPKKRFQFIGSREFFSTDYRPQWLLPHVLVKGQPGVIAGPSKGMKTSVSIDLAVSLAAARPFLGVFDVPRPVRVAVVSGESGEGTLKETGERVAAAKGIDPGELEGKLDWCFTLPTLTDLGIMAEFADELAERGAELVIIDPVYLCLGGKVDAKNLFEMGAAFRIVAEVLLKAGCTPILCHHANRLLPIGEPMDLQHLAYSGLEQFARQFLLLNRRERYAGDGVHDLWMRVGGSAGHGGLWALHITEGITSATFGGRRWELTVQSNADLQASQIDQKEAARRESARKRMVAEEGAVLHAIDMEVSTGVPAASRKSIQSRTGFDPRKLRPLIDALIEDGALEEIEFERTCGNNAKRRVSGVRKTISGTQVEPGCTRVVPPLFGDG